MAVTWTTIPNGDVDVDSPVTTALMTALRDNPEGIAQRASGAPKIFGCPYDFQEFTASGTWTKPSNAESGDRVIVQVVGGGGSGAKTTASQNFSGGGGAGGIIKIYGDIDGLGSSETVVVGAGGAGVSSNSNGNVGGLSSFGTTATAIYLDAEGGGGGNNGSGVNSVGGETHEFSTNSYQWLQGTGGVGVAGNVANQKQGVIFGGGGGGGYNGTTNNGGFGGGSAYAGSGGRGQNTGGAAPAEAGYFPGGGGGATDDALSAPSGAGGAGVVRVWCMREEA